MKQYYIHHNGTQLGPFNVDQIREQRIGHSTMVWYEGLTAWIPANEVAELTVLFVSPPPFQSTPPQIAFVEKRQNRTLPILGIIFSVIFLLWFCFFTMSSGFDKEEFFFSGFIFCGWSIAFSIAVLAQKKS